MRAVKRLAYYSHDGVIYALVKLHLGHAQHIQDVRLVRRSLLLYIGSPMNEYTKKNLIESNAPLD